MNQLVDTHGKAIIMALLVVIAVLAIMLFQSCSTVTTRGSKVSDKNLAAFLDALADPNEDVHGVLLIRRDGHDRLTIYDGVLGPTVPCFSDPKSILTAEKTPILLPRECVKEGSEIDYTGEQIVVLTPGKAPAKEGGGTEVYVTDLDHRVVCTQPNGNC